MPEVCNLKNWSIPLPKPFQTNLQQFSVIASVKRTEAATRGVLCKKVFLETSQNSQENTCDRALRPATLLKMRL